MHGFRLLEYDGISLILACFNKAFRQDFLTIKADSCSESNGFCFRNHQHEAGSLPSYAGFMQGAIITGDDVLRPYTAATEIRRRFGCFGFALGYELDHVEFERALGPEIEFAHLRLCNTYLAFELDF